MGSGGLRLERRRRRGKKRRRREGGREGEGVGVAKTTSKPLSAPQAISPSRTRGRKPELASGAGGGERERPPGQRNGPETFSR